MAVLEVSDVWKNYGKFTALKGLTFKTSGGIQGLVGPNGAGKTTLIRIMLGYMKADQGQCRILGLDAFRDSVAIKRKIGVLNERPYYPGGLTVKEYLVHIAALYGCPFQDELLKIVDLDGNRYIKSLSAGMYRKLGLVQALSHNPQLVILDEPTANLDPLARLSFKEIVMRIHKERKTSFFITSHILSELEQMTTEILVIFEGKIVEQGPSSELMAKYAKEKEYEIIASNPELLLGQLKKRINVLDANIVGNALTVKFTENLQDVLSEIMIITKKNDVNILDFNRKTGLEEIVRSVVNEKSKKTH